MEKKDIRRLLSEQRRRLKDHRERAGEGTPELQADGVELSAVDQHPADQATETFERERAQTIVEQIDARIEEVDSALARVDRGTFGLCEVCGENIPEERLAARPEVRYCIVHQEEVERGEHPSPGR